ncbi:MAG: PQQ-like beta-propeller repeat protein [Gemmataceae bacterium]|nr:PQQ-like beta-propeller repeat protein [Gemmataceae bacterium]
MRSTIAFLLVGIYVGSGLAEDWPQFLGPRRDNTSRENVVPWKGDPKVAWRVPVGEGHSSPVVAGDYVFLHDKVANQNLERVTAFRAADGKAVASIERPRGAFESPFGIGPRSTPTVVGDMVYAVGVTGRFLGLRLAESGTDKSAKFEEKFNHDLLQQFQAKNLTFGVSASPLVEGELVIVPVGGLGAGLVAFRRDTGELAWKSLDDPASYASPVVFGEGANRQIVALTQKGLVGVSPRDGSIYWQYPFQDKLNESSTTPIRVGDILLASSVTLGSVALKLTERDGRPAVEEVWRKPELTCYFSTPVAVGNDHVYMVTGVIGLQPSITLRCVEVATGKTLWSKTRIGKYHAALIRTANDLLLMLDDTGHLTLIQPDPREYRVVARSKVCRETWAHPALAGGRLYLRDDRELICLDLAP